MRGLRTGPADRLLREVVALEAAVREALGEQEQGAAPSAAEVEHAQAPIEPVDETRDQRQDVRDDDGQHGLPAVLRHHLMEAGVARVGHAAALAEAERKSVGWGKRGAVRVELGG